MIKKYTVEKPVSSKSKNLIVIIVSYNCPSFVEKCLDSVDSSTLIPKKVIVFDNNSLKEMVPKIKHYKHCNVVLVKNKKNIGFARAINKVIKSVFTKYILLLNPDMYLKKTAIANLMEVAREKEHEFGAIGGKVLDYQKKFVTNTVINKITLFGLAIEFTSVSKIMKFLGINNPSGFWNRNALLKNEVTQVFGLSGCFMLLRKSTFFKLNLFDPKYFLYLEDIDYCLRASRNNYPCFLVPNSIGYHYGGGSSAAVNPYKINENAWNQSKKYFCAKNFGLKGKLLNIFITLDELIVKLKHMFIK